MFKIIHNKMKYKGGNLICTFLKLYSHCMPKKHIPGKRVWILNEYIEN